MSKIKKKRWLSAFLFGIAASLFLVSGLYGIPAQAKQTDKSVTIVIDPGHGGVGGRNEGGIVGATKEKHATLLTAQAMKQVLEQFEGVEVCLTRTQDMEVSLAQRAQTAKERGADMLVSLHYNMSSGHDLYGTECWTSAFGTSYAAGQSFGRLWLKDMTAQYGLHSRGIKVKLGSRGTDYYGVIREAHNRGIPCVILEHCYLDNPNDSAAASTPEQFVQMGVTDALSVAKYYRLKSAALGIDYSGAVHEKVSAPAGGKAFPDQTPPVILSANARRSGDSVQIGISAQDAESGVRYFAYSVNGGVTWSPLQRWAADGANASYTVPVPAGTDSVMVRVQNAYDLTADTVVQAG